MEIFQRTEHMLGGVKLPEWPTERDEVMTLKERVGEAQRYAKMVGFNNSFDGVRLRDGGLRESLCL